MPASSLRLLLGWITGLTLLAGGACSGPAEINGTGVASSPGVSNPEEAMTPLSYRQLAPELAIPATSRVGVISSDGRWIASLEEAGGTGGSVTHLDLRSSGSPVPVGERGIFDDVLLVESWSTLVRESEADPDQMLQWLSEHLSDGGRLWIIERRFGSGSTSDGRGAAWPHIVDTARLAGFAIRRVDINRLEDHLLVQVEKRGERLNP